MHPSVDDLRHAAAVFNAFRDVDGSWRRFTAATSPAPDLGRADHRGHLLAWLNTWGCRLRYRREGEPPVFDDGLAAWWERWGGTLPAGGLTTLRDDEIHAAATAYAELAAVPLSPPPRARALGPTAAAKALYALRPAAIMPWDAAIAIGQYGARDAGAFAAHLRTGREWALAVTLAAGLPETAVPALVGRPAVSLAKVLDEYLWVTATAPRRG